MENNRKSEGKSGTIEDEWSLFRHSIVAWDVLALFASVIVDERFLKGRDQLSYWMYKVFGLKIAKRMKKIRLVWCWSLCWRKGYLHHVLETNRWGGILSARGEALTTPTGNRLLDFIVWNLEWETGAIDLYPWPGQGYETCCGPLIKDSLISCESFNHTLDYPLSPSTNLQTLFEGKLFWALFASEPLRFGVSTPPVTDQPAVVLTHSRSSVLCDFVLEFLFKFGGRNSRILLIAEYEYLVYFLFADVVLYDCMTVCPQSEVGRGQLPVLFLKESFWNVNTSHFLLYEHVFAGKCMTAWTVKSVKIVQSRRLWQCTRIGSWSVKVKLNEWWMMA